jgi:hypothetical protein
VVEDIVAIKLFALAKRTFSIIKQEQEKQPIGKLKYPYSKPNYVRFDYVDGRVSYETKGVIEATHEVWNFGEIWDRIDILIQPIPEYNAALDAIMKIRSETRAQLDYWIRNFLQRIIELTLENAVEENLLEKSLLFANELEGNAIAHDSTIWLMGIWMKDDEIDIDNGITLKRPTKDYLDSYRVRTITQRDFHHQLPSLIVDHSLKSGNPEEVRRSISKLVLALRLFSIGSVQTLKIFDNTETFLSLGGGVQGSIDYLRDFYKYPIASKDKGRLQNFLKIIEPLVPKTLVDETERDVDYLTIAVQRYNDALLKVEIMESRISFAVMALEALYLGKDERQELKDRLSQRVAKVLGIFGFKPLTVYEQIKRAYDIRSSFVHGSPVEGQGDLTEFAGTILEYVRCSIVIALQIRIKYEKEKFLSSVDKSLLDQDVSDGITKSIKELCKII